MISADPEIHIQHGEGTTLELKEDLLSPFARELAALANSVGGKFFLGVRDYGTAISVKDSDVQCARIQLVLPGDRSSDSPLYARHVGR